MARVLLICGYLSVQIVLCLSYRYSTDDDSTIYPVDYRQANQGCIIDKTFYTATQEVLKSLITSGKEECASACASIDSCQVWNFRTTDNYCVLKSEYGDQVRSEAWMTGTKQCGVKTGSSTDLDKLNSIYTKLVTRMKEVKEDYTE